MILTFNFEYKLVEKMHSEGTALPAPNIASQQGADRASMSYCPAVTGQGRYMGHNVQGYLVSGTYHTRTHDPMNFIEDTSVKDTLS